MAFFCPTLGELLHALNISKPSIIFVSPRTEELVKEVIQEVNPKAQVIQLSPESLSKDVPTLPEVLAETDIPLDLNAFKATEFTDYKKQPAVILCSSGTTGLPKGVLLSHHNLMTLVQHFR